NADAPSQSAQHVSANGGVGRVIDVQPELRVHIADERQAIDVGGSVGTAHDPGRAAELPADVADNPFHDGLDRHDAGSAAVFVDDDRFADVPAAHFSKQIVGAE